MLRNLVYGNVIADFSNNTSLGGTLIISNSCKTSSLNNRASIAFAVADISFGTLKKGLFNNNIDSADARITAIIDTVSPTVGTGLSVSVSSNHANPPVEALRVQSNGNVGIGTQTPQFPLDVNGIVRSTDVRIDNGNIHLGQSAGLTNQGTNAIAIGSNAGQTNQGPNSIAIGSNSSVTGTSSVAIGYNATTSTYNNSVALGTGATSTADNQIRLGTASQNVSILGNVGIGTTNPDVALDVIGTIDGYSSTSLATNAPDTSLSHGLSLICAKSGSTRYAMSLGMDNTNGFGYINAAGNGAHQPVCLQTRGGNVGIGLTSPAYKLDVNGDVRLNAINLQTESNQSSTQLGYRISGVVSLSSTSTPGTWIRPNNSAITISPGVWLLSYAFTIRTGDKAVLMGCMTLLSNLNTVYTNPQSTNVPSTVFAFQGQTNLNANYNSCAQSYVYTNTSGGNETIYLWVACSAGSQALQSHGGYFQAVRIA